MRTFRLIGVEVKGEPVDHGTESAYHEATGEQPKQAAVKLFNNWTRRWCPKSTCKAEIEIVEITKSKPEGRTYWTPMGERKSHFYRGTRTKLKEPMWFAMLDGEQIMIDEADADDKDLDRVWSVQFETTLEKLY